MFQVVYRDKDGEVLVGFAADEAGCKLLAMGREEKLVGEDFKTAKADVLSGRLDPSEAARRINHVYPDSSQ
jgi:hypothetical protein